MLVGRGRPGPGPVRRPRMRPRQSPHRWRPVRAIAIEWPGRVGLGAHRVFPRRSAISASTNARSVSAGSGGIVAASAVSVAARATTTPDLRSLPIRSSAAAARCGSPARSAAIASRSADAPAVVRSSTASTQPGMSRAANRARARSSIPAGPSTPSGGTRATKPRGRTAAVPGEQRQAPATGRLRDRRRPIRRRPRAHRARRGGGSRALPGPRGDRHARAPRQAAKVPTGCDAWPIGRLPGARRSSARACRGFVRWARPAAPAGGCEQTPAPRRLGHSPPRGRSSRGRRATRSGPSREREPMRGSAIRRRRRRDAHP